MAALPPPGPENPEFPDPDLPPACWTKEMTAKAVDSMTDRKADSEWGVLRDGVDHDGFFECFGELKSTILGFLDVESKARKAITRLPMPGSRGWSLAQSYSTCPIGGMEVFFRNGDNGWGSSLGVVRTKEGLALGPSTMSFGGNIHKERQSSAGAADKNWSIELTADTAALAHHLFVRGTPKDASCKDDTKCKHSPYMVMARLAYYFFFGTESLVQPDEFTRHPTEFADIYKAFFHELFTKSNATVAQALSLFTHISHKVQKIDEAEETHEDVYSTTNLMQATIGEMWSAIAIEGSTRLSGVRNTGSGLYSDTDFAKTVTTLDQILDTKPEDGVAGESAGKRSRA